MNEWSSGCHSFHNGDLRNTDLVVHDLFVQSMLKSFPNKMHDLEQVTFLGFFQLPETIYAQLAPMHNALNVQASLVYRLKE